MNTANKENEFDNLLRWASGKIDTVDVEGQLETVEAVRASASVFADRVNSARLAKLVQSLEKVDDAVIERLPMMDDATLLRARRDLEDSIDKTSMRANPIATADKAMGNGGTVINQIIPGAPLQPARDHSLNQDSRSKVQKLAAKVRSMSEVLVVDGTETI